MLTIYLLFWTALRSLKPLRSVSQWVGYQGADMYLDGYGIYLHIPLGAIKPGSSSDVTLSIVHDRPDSDSEDTESFICLGIECSPPDLVFSHPAKIILPHSVSIPSASDVYYTDVVSFKRSSSNGMMSIVSIHVHNVILGVHEKCFQEYCV